MTLNNAKELLESSSIEGAYSKTALISVVNAKTTWSLRPKFPAPMILSRKVSVVSDYHTAQHDHAVSDRQISMCRTIYKCVPGVWDHSRVHMYLIVGIALRLGKCLKF